MTSRMPTIGSKNAFECVEEICFSEAHSAIRGYFRDPDGNLIEISEAI
jgi:hypothetical protein